MKIGDIIESAIWITGDEPAEMRARYEQDVCNAIDYLCHEHRFLHGPVTFIEKFPGADDVPPVPDHIHGLRVRLLVGESTVTDKAIETVNGSFVYELDRVDLEKLRKITRRVHSQYHLDNKMSNEECDKIIEEIGPDAALATLKTLH